MRESLKFRETARRLLTYLPAGRQTLNNQRRFEFPGFLPVPLVVRDDGASGFQTTSAVLTYKTRDAQSENPPRPS